ncbi:uncharacterized protein ATNIH1004_009153 [Aspergillus tanneri]|uniref:Uncharacterized protein n=1 Tax=Aspergillus tanneri TaxID=1220188 RepID=A0A5M9MD84_9EURO|nr:uncharacterized protein ATNIH1004_009153 [Aspergillus tanneri]KAA8644942.1 hypothetical protein ATNIH1004_009153 [Aspergillus tanneri]
MEAGIKCFEALYFNRIFERIDVRLTHMILYLIVQHIRQDPERYINKPREKGDPVLAYILSHIPGITQEWHVDKRSLRNVMSNYLSQSLASCMYSIPLPFVTIPALTDSKISTESHFVDGQLGALVTFIAQTRPGTVALFRSMGSMLNCLLSGPAAADFTQHCLPGEDRFIEASKTDDAAAIKPDAATSWKRTFTEQGDFSFVKEMAQFLPPFSERLVCLKMLAEPIEIPMCRHHLLA